MNILELNLCACIRVEGLSSTRYTTAVCQAYMYIYFFLFYDNLHSLLCFVTEFLGRKEFWGVYFSITGTTTTIITTNIVIVTVIILNITITINITNSTIL